jgi:predicted ATPase
MAGVRRISLSGLDREGTSALVCRIVAGVPSQEYLAEVHRRSGGNPFFTPEVARLQASRGMSTGAMPEGVRQVLEVESGQHRRSTRSSLLTGDPSG